MLAHLDIIYEEIYTEYQPTFAKTPKIVRQSECPRHSLTISQKLSTKLVQHAAVHLLDKQEFLRAQVHLLPDATADPVDTHCPGSLRQPLARASAPSVPYEDRLQDQEVARQDKFGRSHRGPFRATKVTFCRRGRPVSRNSMAR